MTGLNHRYFVRNLAIPAAGFTPTDIAGLVAWHDASNAGSITASGGAVSQWNDLSGGALHLTQATGSAQPSTGAATVNGLNVIRFDGTGDNMLTSGGSIGQPYTLFTVVKTRNAAGTQETIWMPQNDGRIYRTSGGNFAAYAGTVLDSGIASGTANAHVAVAVINGASSKIAVDGSATSGAAGALAGGAWYVGSNFGATGEFAAIDACELLRYDTALSDANRNIVEAYLKAKWGTP